MVGGCVPDRYQHYFSNAPLVQNAPAISVQRGDNLYQVSKRYDVTLRDLIEINHLKPPYHIRSGQALLLPQKRLHIVRRHETLTSIARQRNVDVHSLVKMNNLKPPYTLHENQRLKLSYPTIASPSPRPIKPKVVKVETRAKEVEPLLPHKLTRAAPIAKRVPKIEPLLPLEKKPVSQKRAAVKEDLFDIDPPQKPFYKNPQKKSSKTTGRPAAKTISKPPVKPPLRSKAQAARQEMASNQAPISKFQWPVKGKILAKYGNKSAGLRNDGVNIQAKKGTPIKAAESGQVVYVGSALKGYGNLILLKHRGGWLTAYAHAQKTFVSKGQQIKKGQKIALVGSTGSVKTPQLHFELRKKTRTLDPLPYLK
jgi:murein DD-endopeptidase MepM/ murein hydrolase activator NlpD